MVLEQLFPERWWKRTFWSAAALAGCYMLISAVLARLIFGDSSGIVSVMFVTLFLLPSVKRLFAAQERAEEAERHLTLTRFWKDNEHTITLYAGIFTGILLGYLLLTVILPLLGFPVLNIFREQLLLDPALAGRASGFTTFVSILANNWIVLLATFLLAMVWSDGALFFIAWNASAWGAIFGYRALAASVVSQQPAILVLGQEMLIVGWHTAIEASAYLVAAIAGTIIADEVVHRSTEKRRFVTYGGGLLVMGVLLSRLLKGAISNVLLETIALITMSLLLIWLLKYTFTDAKHKQIFTNNLIMLLVAVILFVIGAYVEHLVITQSATYARIVELSGSFRLG